MSKREEDVSSLFWETVLSIADQRGWVTANEISEKIGFAYARVYEALDARAQDGEYPGIQTAKWQETLDSLGMNFWEFICRHPAAPMVSDLGIPAHIQSRMAAVLSAREMDQLVSFAEIAVRRGTFKELLTGLIGTFRATE